MYVFYQLVCIKMNICSEKVKFKEFITRIFIRILIFTGHLKVHLLN